jgi:hypothetical protein
MTNGPSQTLKARLARLGLVAQAMFVAAALLFAGLLLAPLAYTASGRLGLSVELLAAVVCWLGALFSLSISALIRGGVSVMNRLALGMTARAMVPLVLGVGLHHKHADLAGAGLIFYVLAFYMVTLAADTVLLVAQVPQPLVPRKAH